MDRHEHDGITVGMKVVRVANQEGESFLSLQCPDCGAMVHLAVVEARIEDECDCHSEGDDQELAESDFSVSKADPTIPVIKRSRALAEAWAKANGYGSLENYFRTPEGSVWRDYDFAP